jgi:hypothetical protein
MMTVLSYTMLRMTHPSRNFFVLSLFCVLRMFVWRRVQGCESSVNKVFQKDQVVNLKTINLQCSFKIFSSAGTNFWFMMMIVTYL